MAVFVARSNSQHIFDATIEKKIHRLSFASILFLSVLQLPRICAREPRCPSLLFLVCLYGHFQVTKMLPALSFDAKMAVFRLFVECEIQLHCHQELRCLSMDYVLKMHVHACRSSFSARKDCTPSSNAQSPSVECPSAEPVQHPGLQEHTRASLRKNPRTGLAQGPWRKSTRTRSA